jgi:outer membrane protein insertion porin family
VGSKGSGHDARELPLRRGGFDPRKLGRLALLLLLLAAETATGQEPPRIHSITFSGNAHIDSGDLRSTMRLRGPAWWRPFSTPRFPGADFLAGDLNAIIRRYHDEGFPHAQIADAVVRYNAAGDAVDIQITIDEGPFVRVSGIRFSGVDPKDVPKILQRLSLSKGEPLSASRLESDQLAIQRYFEDKGHALVETVREIRFQGDKAEVIFRVTPGPKVRVGSIVVDPMEKTREVLVRQEIALKPGDLLTPRRLLESRRRLLDTQIFRSVRVRPEFPDSTGSTAVVHITAREGKASWVGAGAGYSSADQLRFLTDWGIRNISGLGRRMTENAALYYSLDPQFRDGGINFKEGLIQLEYLEPRIRGTRTRATVGGYLRWLQENTFQERILGYSFGLRREIRLSSRASVAIENRDVTTLGADVPRYTTRSVRLDYSNDLRDNPLDPTRGRFFQPHADYAGGLLGGTNQFGRLSVVYQGYARPLGPLILAGRIRLGYIEPLSGVVGAGEQTPANLRVARIPWEERFRLGGGTTIRGYAEDDVGRHNAQGEPIGGLAMLLGNVEVRLPVVWIIRLGVFLDLGNVWADAREITVRRFTRGLENGEPDPRDVYYGAGAGLRFTTPVGPLRFDYGYKLGTIREPGQGRAELHVALGQAF